MCETCGCSEDRPDRHDHPHDHGHEHGSAGRLIALEQNVLARNDRAADRNRSQLGGRGTLALNLMSAPGAGKTTLLERTIEDLGASVPIVVIEGDQATTRDADRIRAAGGRALQINTGKVCHLDAEMVSAALEEITPADGSIVMIENVGNLVCPALFDLGESARIVIVSVAEGDDKPIKYPHMFRTADVMLLNKIDLLPHVRFDIERCLADVRLVNPRLRVLEVSATRGDGLAAWYDWLRERLAAVDQVARGREIGTFRSSA
jgi:hydrogenase nickel incorporation protein HypB